MPRPGLRPMRTLPLLEPRRAELEKCVFCPKLCRSACPVSNAEPRETITPWGKMSFAWMTAHGDVPLDRSHAAPAWACTGCYGCRSACDHRNPVADVLLDARDALVREGVAPPEAMRVLQRFPRHDADTRAAARELTSHPRVRGDSQDALLIGCGYLRDAPREARDAIDAASALMGGPVALVEACCGSPLRMAGDKEGFTRHARTVARSLEGRRRVLVVDAGCAMALKRRYPEAGVEVPTSVELLVEHAARAVASLAHVPHDVGQGEQGGQGEQREQREQRDYVRWHDPCQLGRGLGVYDAPRAVLTRALGRAPDEFDDAREWAACSGAGGLLPSTMPEVAGAIANARIDAHVRAGGGRIVTACASSLVALRKRAAGSSIAIDDLVTWIARATRGL
jgi:Fe-S oxidoreductase